MTAADRGEAARAGSPDPRRWRELARLRRRRADVRVGATALLAALLALPLAPSSWHGPEVAAVLAVAATALLAGQRWAISVVVIAQLLLLPTIWPRAILPASELAVRLAALGALLALVPGVIAMRRAAAALVLVTGWRRTQTVCRRLHAALVLAGLLALSLPLI
ncbi:MAG TPA: hypothetical protein VNO30_03115 [Kofleriaceae bacterium]|nr:hypothetical protein [Kofleriaceae bacterium]